MIIKQLSVFVENQPGRMAEITGTIAEAGIDIRALSLADTSDFGILRLIVDNPEQAALTLGEHGMAVTLTDVIAVGVPDTPGEFARAVRVMSDAGVNIEYLYAFVTRTDDIAVVIFKVDDAARSVKALEGQGLRLLSHDEVYDL